MALVAVTAQVPVRALSNRTQRWIIDGITLAVNCSAQDASTISVINRDGSLQTKLTFAGSGFLKLQVTANAVTGPIAITTPGGIAVSQGTFTGQ